MNLGASLGSVDYARPKRFGGELSSPTHIQHVESLINLLAVVWRGSFRHRLLPRGFPRGSLGQDSKVVHSTDVAGFANGSFS